MCQVHYVTTFDVHDPPQFARHTCSSGAQKEWHTVQRASRDEGAGPQRSCISSLERSPAGAEEAAHHVHPLALGDQLEGAFKGRREILQRAAHGWVDPCSLSPSSSSLPDGGRGQRPGPRTSRCLGSWHSSSFRRTISTAPLILSASLTIFSTLPQATNFAHTDTVLLHRHADTTHAV